MSLIRLPQVLAVTGLSRTSLHRQEAAGVFPRRRKIGARAVAWDNGLSLAVSPLAVPLHSDRQACAPGRDRQSPGA